MSTNPTRPASEALDAGTERLILERLETLERDKKDAKPWAEVKALIVETSHRK